MPKKRGIFIRSRRLTKPKGYWKDNKDVSKEEFQENLNHYIAAGKFKPVETKKFSKLRLVFELLCVVIVAIGYVIKNNLSKVIPALARPKFIIRDKVAVVTGAAGGFGRRLVEQLAERGATVACIDVDKAANERCVEAVNSAASCAGRKESTPAAFAFSANLRNREETQNVIKEIEEKLGRVDILVHTAACFTTYDICGFEDDEIDFLVDLNFKSTIWLIRAILPGMKKRNSGHIAVFSSVAALVPAPGLTIYAACKSALKGLLNSLYLEVRNEGLDIGVTTIYPFFSATSPIIRERIDHRLPNLDPYKVVKVTIDAIETRELNLVIPRYLSPLAGIYGLFPKDVLGYIMKVFGYRINTIGIMPKATITVDKWTEVYGAFRGPKGEFIKVHDDDEVTPQMFEKSTTLMKKLKRKIDQGDDSLKAFQDIRVQTENEYASKENHVS